MIGIARVIRRTLREGACEQAQRDCGLQPKVARNELPWVTFRNQIQPQRGYGHVSELVLMRAKCGANRAADAQSGDLRLPGDFHEMTAERMRREFRFGIAEGGFAPAAAGYQAKIGAAEDVSEGDATAGTAG